MTTKTEYLLQLARTLKEKQIQIATIENQIFDFSDKNKEKEIEFRIKIDSEIDQATGKKRYTNDTMRGDALFLYEQQDKEYMEQRGRYRKLLSERDNLRIEEEFYRNLIKIHLGEVNV